MWFSYMPERSHHMKNMHWRTLHFADTSAREYLITLVSQEDVLKSVRDVTEPP